MQRNRGKQQNDKDQKSLKKKIRDREGTVHAKVGTINDRNDIDLTESEDIKKRLKEYIELYKKF